MFRYYNFPLSLRAVQTNLLKCQAIFPLRGIVASNSTYYGNSPKNATYTLEVPDEVKQSRSSYSQAYRLVEAYRKYGHLSSDTNPLLSPTSTSRELDETEYSLSLSDSCPSQVLSAWESSRYPETLTIEQLCSVLKDTYCGPISAEYMHLLDASEREWFALQFESGKLFDPLTSERKRNMCRIMLESEVFDQFLGSKFQALKRYGGEGAEALLVLYDGIFRSAAHSGVEDIVIGMNHRGRMNLQTGLLQLPLPLLFRKIMGNHEFDESLKGSGDVLSHLKSVASLEYDSDKVRVELLTNPSHLEAVNPVAMGRVREMQRKKKTGMYGSEDAKSICLLVHGDAAISGQGIVQESLNLSSTPHFNIGGCIHVIVNNQIGFTNPGHNARSSLYASDVGLMIRSPVLRVNGNCPESVSRAADIAVAYQQTFGKDIFLDVLCWRKHGHNELDDPTFTNPLMYRTIKAFKSVPDTYAHQLIADKVMSEEDVQTILNDRKKLLSNCLEQSHSYTPKATTGLPKCSDNQIEIWDTGVSADTLRYVAAKSVEVPSDFNLHPHLEKVHVRGRLKKIANDSIDWATAEAMAMGSLLLQGLGVRLCGQDVMRGTFSHRHCGLVDQQTEEVLVPLNGLKEGQEAFLEVANSILSEEAVLGYEYGMSLNNKDTLPIWEAQFGDFFNGAQIILDTFISSCETKWLEQSGIVMVLPHGYDGAGPEHSCCRVERFLTACDSNDNLPDTSDVNWMVAAPTLPSQYFHLLRQQMVRPYRKPLVIVGPKSLLRLPAATSELKDMQPGTHFLPVIDDPSIGSKDSVRKVVFTSGKHYYALCEERSERGLSDTAIVRLESLCPFPSDEVLKVLRKYGKASKYIWSQEEPRNLGPWSFMFPRFLNLCGVRLRYAGRTALSAPAVGVGKIHKEEVESIYEQTFV